MEYGIYYAYWEKQWGADYLQYVEKVARLGFDILEISCAGLKDMTDARIEALSRSKDEHGIRLTAGYGPRACENIASSDPAVVQNALEFWKQTFCVLQKLGVESVGGGLYSYWPADYSADVEKQEDLERSIRNMRTLASLADSYGITLCMESLNRHEGYLINTARECVEYVNAVGAKNVKVMLDTYHMNMEEDSFREAILTAGPLLGHFHVGENNRRLPGQGSILPWREIGDALRKINYKGDVVMEPFVIHGGQVGQDIRIWRDLLEDTSQERLDQDAAESVRFLRGVFEEQPGSVKGLAHIGLYVSDIARSVRFYTGTLHFKLIWQNLNPSPDGDVSVAFVRKEDCILELICPPDPGASGAGCFKHIALRVDDLDFVMERLEKEGIQFEEGSYKEAPQVFENGSRWVFLNGPDHEQIELNERFL